MQTIGAKIQLDGEKQFQTSLKNIVQQSKTLAAEMKNLSSSFDKTTSSQDKAKAKIEVLNKQLDVQKKYIDTLNGKYDSQKAKLQEIATEYDKVAKEQGENSTEAQKLAEQYTKQETALNKTKEQINKAETAYNNMERELKECKEAAKDAVVPVKTFAEKAAEAGEKVQAAGERVKAFGDKLSSAGKTLSTRVTAPLVALGGKGVQAFAEVDKTMTLTNKTMGNTAKEAGLLSDAMKDAASKSTYGMSDAATATLNFARAGLDATQAAAALAPAMNLAAGEGGDLDTVSAGLVATINGFHGSFDDAAHYADVFAAACNNSALDIDSLSNAMSVAAPIFSSAGYSVNDAALYMGVMANNGIEADKAANSLKTGIARLVSPAKEGAEMMDQLGISVTNSDGSMKSSIAIQQELHDTFINLSESEQIAAASAIFGKNQMAPWLALINTAPDDVWQLSAELDGASISIDDFSKNLEKNGLSIDAMRSNMEKLGVSQADFDEALKLSGGNAKDFAETLLEWTNPGVKAKDVTKALGGDLAGLQKIMNGTKGTTQEMADAMMSGFGGSLEQLKSTLDVLITTIGERLAPYISKLTDKLLDLASRFNAMTPEQQKMIIKLAGIAAAIGPVIFATGKLVSIGGSAITTTGKLLKAAPKIAKGIKAVGTAFKAMGALVMAHPVIAIAAVIAGIIAALVTLYKKNEWFRNKVNAILDSLKNKWNEFKVFFGACVNSVKAIIDTLHKKFTAAKNTIVNVANMIKTAFNTMKAGIQSAINSAKSAVQSFVAKVNDVKAKVQSTVNAIRNFFSGLKPKIPAPDISWIGTVKSKLQNLVSTIKGFFSGLKLKIPKPSLPALPHFSLQTGSKTIAGKEIKYPTGISVKWYDKGGIFSSPSIIGVGERRPEFVGALDDLRKIVREETGGSNITIVVNGAEGQDVRQLANIVYDKLNRQLQREGAYA